MRSLILNPLARAAQPLRIILLLLIMLRMSFQLYAAEEAYNSHQVLSATPPALEVYDGRYAAMNFDPMGWSNSFTNSSVSDYVKLGINPGTPQTSSFSVTVNMTISYKTWNATLYQFDLQTMNKALTVTYDINGQNTINDKASHVFTGGHYVKVVVNSIVVNSGTCSPTNLYLDAGINVRRFYDFLAAINPSGVSHTPVLAADILTSPYLDFNWNNQIGAEFYELEYVHINDYTFTAGSYTSPSLLAYNYYMNATRVEVTGTHYRIPKIFDHGYVIYRVRGIGRKSGPDFTDRWEGNWSAVESGTIASHPSANVIAILNEYDHDMNWEHEIGYSDGGKRMEGVHFSDGMGRERQTVGLNPVTGQLIVSNTYYDDMGREVASDLPTPVSGVPMKHMVNFNLANVSGTPAYSSAYFEGASGSCSPTPIGFSTTSGAGKYYSQSNLQDDGANASIPDAELFPFSRVEYKHDLLDRIGRSGSAGPTLTLNGGHETRYIEVSSNQVELNRMFGTEIGWANNYQKLVTIDENGQAHVQYLDMDDRTVASYMMGSSPVQLDPLADNVVVAQDNVLIDDGVGDSEDLTVPSSTLTSTQLIMQTGDYSFDYYFTPTQYTAVCGENSICLDCVYDFSIKVVDDCGTVYLNTTETINGTDLNTTCSPGNYDLPETTLHLFGELGGRVGVEYTIMKTLTVNTDAVDDYWCYYLEVSCIDELADIFNEMYKEQSFDGCTEVTDNEDSGSECTIYRNLMLQDVSPGGQYADFILTGTVYTFPDPVSLLNPSNSQRWNTAVYLDEFSNPILVQNSLGVMVSPATLGNVEFIQKFQASWAPSLLAYHPEYCFLQDCESTVNDNSQQFDQDMRNIHSFGEAYTQGYFRPMGTLSGVAAPTSVTGLINGSSPVPASFDPFFTANTTERAAMNTKMQSYITIGGVSLSMWDYAVGLAMGCTDPGFATCVRTFKPGDCSEDYIWLRFRELYLLEKMNLMNLRQQSLCGSVNATIGVSGAYINKVRRWPNLAELEALNPEDSDPEGTDAADLAASCTESCTDYADEWLEKLSGCNINPLILPNVRQDLIDLCMSGCTQDNPLPSSTSPGGQTIQDVLNSYGITESDVCTELLISAPGPYRDPKERAGEFITPLDTCGCDILLQAALDFKQHQLDFPSDPLYTSVEQMLEHNTGIFIEEIDPLLCACKKFSKGLWVPGDFEWGKGVNDDLASTTFTIPVALGCDPVDCRDCAEVNAAFVVLSERFPQIEESLNYNTILANYMNGEFDFHLTSSSWQEFMDRCNATPENPYCTPNPLVEEWLDMMTLVTYRGQLLQTSIALETENVVFQYGEFSDIVPGGIDAIYSVAVDGENVTLHYGTPEDGECTIELDNSQGIDMSAIVSFNAVYADETGCGGVKRFQLEVSYLQCGVLKTTTLPARSHCFDVMTCVCGEELTICDDLTPGTEEAQTPCYQPLLDGIYNDAFDEYTNQVEAAYAFFRASYLAKCAAAFHTENMTYSGFENNYQYTLSYYDQAGNLVRTVAPEGVHLLAASQSAAIDDARLHGRDLVPSTPIVPSHDFETRYKHNSYDDPVQTTNPDQIGETKYWYDRYGNIAASQNPVQAAELKYTYILYDVQGRPVETGQICRTVPPSGGGSGYVIAAISETKLKKDDLGAEFKLWVYDGIRTEVTMTTYDKPLSTAIPLKFKTGAQKNLRLRIATVAYFESIPLNLTTLPNYYKDSYTTATHYSYDIHGNILEQLQDVPQLQNIFQDVKSTQYTIELVSGLVKKVRYQDGDKDQLIHEYAYDGLNRLSEVFTSTDKAHYSREAHYLYYEYGPIARVEIGEHKVQGEDYAYTINGWIKGKNAGTLNPLNDAGSDGKKGYTADNSVSHKSVAMDVTGYMMGYFEGDYKPIGNNTMEPATIGTLFGTAGKNLYNGNIRHTVMAIQGMKTLGAAYQYDQLNRLKSMKTYYNTNLDNLSANNWATGVNSPEYQSDYTYDRNGNLTFLNRNGNSATGLDMDEFEYKYPANGSEPWNRLNYVKDNGTDYAGYNDIKSTQLANNYQYDAIGQLTKDVQAGITAVDWRRGDRKMRKLSNATGEISFLYDPSGLRIAKIVKPGGTTDQTLWIYTYYAYDVNGQLMGVYDIDYGTTNVVYVDERHIYGSARIGMIDEHKQIWTSGTPVAETAGLFVNTLGKKRYELVNHLGNVNAVITDRKVPSQTVYPGYVNSFDTGVEGWSASTHSSCSVPVGSGQLVVTTIPGGLNYVLKNLSLVMGEEYTIAVTVTNGTAPGLSLVIPAGNGTYALTSGITNYINFTAVSTASVGLTIKPTATTGSYTFYVQEVVAQTHAKYLAVVKMKSDYYPYGMEMPGRFENDNTYRYGYNGMEKDDEIKTGGNSYTTEFRQYDPRLGRWLSLDPIMAGYPDMSPYAAFNDNPVFFIDPYGLEGLKAGGGDGPGGKKKKGNKGFSKQKHRKGTHLKSNLNRGHRFKNMRQNIKEWFQKAIYGAGGFIKSFQIGRLGITIRWSRYTWTGMRRLGIKFDYNPRVWDIKWKKIQIRINFQINIPYIFKNKWVVVEEEIIAIPPASSIVVRSNNAFTGKIKVMGGTFGRMLPPNLWPDVNNPDLNGNRATFSYGGGPFRTAKPIMSLFFKTPEGNGGVPFPMKGNGQVTMRISGKTNPNQQQDYYIYAILQKQPKPPREIGFHLNFSIPMIKHIRVR